MCHQKIPNEFAANNGNWLGLKNEAASSCQDGGCDGILNWLNGPVFSYDASYMTYSVKGINGKSCFYVDTYNGQISAGSCGVNKQFFCQMDCNDCNY